MGKKVAVVAGATGLVGRELVRQLCESENHSAVIALVRSPIPNKFDGANERLVIREIPSGEEEIIGDEFYCVLGTTIKNAGSQQAFTAVDHDLVLDLARRAKLGRVPRVVVVTSVGSDLNSSNFYLRVKGQTEHDLKSLRLENLEIYRPSLLIGERSESRLLERLGVLLAPVFSWCLRGPLEKYCPIKASDLARKMILGESLPG